MDGDDKQKLDEIYDLVKDNNKMLHSVQSSRRWTKFWRAIYLLALIAITIVGYYYLEPYFKALQKTYTTLQQGVSEIQQAGNTMSEGASNISAIFKKQ